MFFYSDTILAGQGKKNNANINNQTLYEYYQKSFHEERTKEAFVWFIDFFNEKNIFLNNTICQLILRCDSNYCVTFMLNIKIFFSSTKFQDIKIQQFAEWFDDDAQQLITFSMLSSQQIKQIAEHNQLSVLATLYKGFGFPNIDEINIIFRPHQDVVSEQEKIVRDIMFQRMNNLKTMKNSSHKLLIPPLAPLTKLLKYMHNNHLIVTNRFFLWMCKILPHHLFKNTCQKMIVFLKKLAHPFEFDAIIDMITKNHLNSFVLCNDDDIEYIASLDKINDIMIVQQGQEFPDCETIKCILETEKIETIWPELCTQFKGHGFPTLPTMLLFLKRNDQYDKKIETYIHLIKNNNQHIQWNCIESNALHSVLYFLLSNNVKDILLLSHIFFNVSKNCFTVIDRMMRFFSYLDHHLINIRKLSGMLYSSDAIQMFIELPNNTLQLLAKYEKSNDIMKFLQEENSVLLKKWTEITNVIQKYSCCIIKYNNPELHKQFTKLKMYWIIGFISINLDKEKIYFRWNTTIERDFIPVFEALLEKNIIIDDRLYATLFNHRQHRNKLCKKLAYLFSHQFFSQHFFEFFIYLLNNDDNYLKFIKSSNKDLEDFLTNATHSNNSRNFYFLKKSLKNDDINDADTTCTHQTDEIQHIQLDTIIFSTHQLLLHEQKNNKKNIFFGTFNKLLHNPCWKDAKSNFDPHRLCAVSNMLSGGTHPIDPNTIRTMLNWDLMQQVDGSINYHMLYILSFLCSGHGLPDKEKAQQLQIWLMMNSANEQLSLSIFMLKMPIIGMGLNTVNKLFNYDEKVRSLMRQHSLRLRASDYFPLKRVSLYLLCDYIQLDTLDSKVPEIKKIVEKEQKVISKSTALETLVSLMEHEKIFFAH